VSLELLTLKRHCRAAALGDYSWESVLKDLCQWVEGDKAILMHSDFGGAYHSSISYNHDPSVLAKYNEGFNASDPRMPFSKMTPAGVAKTGQQYVQNCDIDKTPYYNEILVAADIFDSVHAVIFDTQTTGRQALSIHRSFKGDFFEQRQIDRIEVILPYLIEAMQYAIEFTGRFNLSSSSPSFGALMDEKLNIRLLNGEVYQVLNDCHSLGFDGVYLRPKRTQLKNGFLRAFTRAKRGMVSKFRLDVTPTAGEESDVFLRITVSPRPSLIDWMPGVNNSVMLHIVRITQDKAVDVETFAKVFELTGAERRTLEMLSREKDTRHAAIACGISYSTLRWHLKNIFSKTGYKSQDLLMNALKEMDFTNAT